MISLSKMVAGKATVSKRITYDGEDSHVPKRLVELGRALRPVVVWNLTKACNLRCVHCYASAEVSTKDELTTEECKAGRL